MLALRTHSLSFAHSSAISLLADVDLHLGPGWTGLVGENGAGKTTLLRLLAGDLAPDAGHVRVEPPSARIVLVPQTVEAMGPDIEDLAARDDGAAQRVRGELGLDPGEIDRWPTLSPGERKRWQIGAALASGAEVLLLDEPSNHLDAPARALLLGALRRFRGVGVVVSHDRALLGELTTATLRVHRAGARLYKGPYDVARRAWEAEAEAEVATHRRFQEEKRAIERRLADARRDRAGAEANLSTRRRMRNKNDSDARGIGANFRVEQAEKGLGRKVSVLRDQLERASDRASSISIEKALGRSIFVDYERAPTSILFWLDAPSIRAGDREILGRVTLSVGPESRVRVEGPNGAGKTTLLAALLANARIPRDKVLHVPQDLDTAAARALLREVRALSPVERGRTLSVVAALGVDPDRLLASADPSPGEARKLMIALGLGRHVWVLVLDEPTNHLDLPSLERLEAALEAYPGAILLVTHDDAFGRRTTTTSWRVEDGTVRMS